MMSEVAPIAETRTCRKCGQDTPLALMAKAGAAGHRAQCKACWAAYMRGWGARNKDKISAMNKAYKEKNPQRYIDSRLRCMFGITGQDYDEMMRKQDGRCKCCGVEASTLTKRLAVDHCHVTDEVRGLLCMNCNTALGLVGDNIDTLKSLIAYLEESGRKQGEIA